LPILAPYLTIKLRIEKKAKLRVAFLEFLLNRPATRKDKKGD